MLEGKKMKKKHQDNLQTWYKLNEKGNPKVKEEILLGIKVKSSKINRYQQRMNQFQQKSLFRNNEGHFISK